MTFPKLPNRLVAGLLVGSVPLLMLLFGRHLEIGTPDKMGAGFFPLLTGAVLTGLAIAICFIKSEHEDRTTIPWWPLITVVTAIVLFALSFERIGVIPSVVSVVFISMFAEKDFSLTRFIASAAVLSVLCWLLFTKLLRLPVAAFPWE